MIGVQLLEYLIDFLIGPVYEASPSDQDSELVGRKRPRRIRLVRYTSDPEEMRGAHVVVRPSSFFDMDIYGTKAAEPQLPLAEWEGVPLLYGESRHEWINGGETLLLHADLIASAYYLLSRYEEMYRRGVRDEYGRFPGCESLPYRAGFIHRPIVDEYGEALRRLLVESGIVHKAQVRLEERKPFFDKVNLTHDVDQPYQYRGLKGYVRALINGRNPIKMLRRCFGSPKNDAYFTFPKIMEWNRQLQRNTPEGLVDTILFLKTPAKHQLDKPNYKLRSRCVRMIRAYADRAHALYGLHCSYEASLDTTKIVHQRKHLQETLGGHIKHSRHHFLALREPEDMLELLGAGIRHDYTMGYADVAGFRLGTCRVVRFINPNTRSLTDLMMHPLTIMDVSLHKYMKLSYHDAEVYASSLVRTVAHHGGELNLLWHNEQFAEEVHPWHSMLYRALLRLVQELEEGDPRGITEDDIAFRRVVSQHGCTEIKVEQ